MTGQTAQSRRWTWPRLALVIVGSLLALAGLGAALIGATILSQANDGAVDFGNTEVHSDAHTLVSEPLDWSSETYLGGTIERASFQVTTADDGAPVFVGLVAPADLDSHLANGEVVDAGLRFPYTEYASAPTNSLHETGVWTAEAAGTGQADLAFDAAEQQDERALVITNTDREPLHSVTVESYGSVPAATMVAVGLTAGGVVLLIAAVVLIVMPIRAAHRQRG